MSYRLCRRPDKGSTKCSARPAIDGFWVRQVVGHCCAGLLNRDGNLLRTQLSYVRGRVSNVYCYRGLLLLIVLLWLLLRLLLRVLLHRVLLHRVLLVWILRMHDRCWWSRDVGLRGRYWSGCA